MLYYVDHTSRFDRNTGIQRCVRSIAKALLALQVPLRPVVWNRSEQDFVLASPDALQHLSRWSGPEPEDWALQTPHGVEHPCDSWLLIVELVSGPHNPDADQLRRAADRHGLKVAWVFHDAIPVLYQHLQGQDGSLHAWWHRRYMRGLVRFERVLANSRNSAKDLRRFLQEERVTWNSDPEWLRVVCLADGVSEARSRLGSTISRQVLRDPFVLCVGSLELRKNHRALLKAFVWLNAQGSWPERLQLVLVGWGQHPAVVEMVQRVINQGLPLRWEVDATDEHLHQLYRSSFFTVYPSLVEGFGLPVAESLAYGKACLCGRNGAIGELAAAGGCLSVDTGDWFSLARGLLKLSLNNECRLKLELEAKEKRPLRTWRIYAEELLAQLK